MKVSATALRQNIYGILDEALETGEIVEVERKGRILKIVPEDAPVRRLAKLKKRNVIIGNPDDLIYMDWSSEWSELKK